MGVSDLDAVVLGMDAEDDLSSFRDQFHMPVRDVDGREGEKKVYLCGNSLGLMPKRTSKRLNRHMESWAREGVDGHFAGDEAWLKIEDLASLKSAEIVGAKRPLEVVYMNTLTVNIHLMMVAFYRPTADRYKILIEQKAFPSDDYAVQSQVLFHGYDPDDAIIRLTPREGEATLRTDDILRTIEEKGHELALVFLPGVQYYTGQVLPMQQITEASHRIGVPVGFDLAHAVGNIELHLHDWQVDFATWCSYKYLNSGPGAVSGVFLHAKHADNTDLPRFAGWWGYDRESRFKMEERFVPQKGAYGFQLSNPPVLATVPVTCSLEVFAEAGMERLRRKSEKLTALLEELLNRFVGEDFRMITPREPSQRGCQLSIQLLHVDLKKVHLLLEEDGVVCDTREPDVMRVAPVPMYNTYADVLAFVRSLSRAIKAVKEQQKA